jgi:hypothetical protein
MAAAMEATPLIVGPGVAIAGSAVDSVTCATAGDAAASSRLAKLCCV